MKDLLLPRWKFSYTPWSSAENQPILSPMTESSSERDTRRKISLIHTRIEGLSSKEPGRKWAIMGERVEEQLQWKFSGKELLRAYRSLFGANP